MINVMLDPLPEEWNGYKVNTSFRIGIQVFLVQYDKELNEYEKSDALIYLLFDEREHPDGDDLRQCVEWFLNGWFHDKPGSSKDNRRLVDYDIDQWRIYADFRQIYGIDLSLDDMHWWMFNGLLWNMPYKQSSFQQVIEIRRKKITSKMGKEERQAIKEAQEMYALEQPEEKKEYTEDEKAKIDEYDQMMAEIRAKKKELDAEVKKKARQVAADRKKRRAGITFRLFMLAIVPVIVMVLGLITTTVFSLKSGLEEEAMDGLELLSGAVQSSYEDIKGNYEYKNGRLFKGGEELTIKPAALDIYVKNSKNDVQVTLTYGTKRVLTTLTDNKGARLTGTDISSEVWDVVKTGKTYRDTNYKVDGKRYCAVYVPLKDNNQVVGCVFAGQPLSLIHI